MGVNNGLVIFLPHVSDFQALFSQCDFPSCFCQELGLVLAGSGNQVGDGTLASMLVPGCHSQFCHLSYALLLSEPIINEIMTVETFNIFKMFLKIYVKFKHLQWSYVSSDQEILKFTAIKCNKINFNSCLTEHVIKSTG